MHRENKTKISRKDLKEAILEVELIDIKLKADTMKIANSVNIKI
jgi:hypothetical protein